MVGSLVAVGNRVIAYTPGDVSKAAIELFRTYDKIALVVGTGVILVVLLAVAGAASIERWWIGASAIVAIGLVASIAAVRNVGASALAVVPVVVGGSPPSGCSPSCSHEPTVWGCAGSRRQSLATRHLPSPRHPTGGASSSRPER